jgi:hypothetical protein
MEWPEEWKTSLFVPIPKKGDPRDCGNNQTIALIPHCSKIMLLVLQKRMQPFFESEISRYQAGFQRKKRYKKPHQQNVNSVMVSQPEGQENIFVFHCLLKSF